MYRLYKDLQYLLVDLQYLLVDLRLWQDLFLWANLEWLLMNHVWTLWKVR
jgi:hypothetical protein